MYSFKNIKATFHEKVKNANTKADMALGIGEVVGKSLVSATTAIIRETPNLMINSIEDTMRKGNQAIKNDSLGEDQIERFSNFKEQAQGDIETLKGYSNHGFFQAISTEAIENREREKLEKQIEIEVSRLEKLLLTFEELSETIDEMQTNDETILDDETAGTDSELSDKLRELVAKRSENAVQILEIKAKLDALDTRLSFYKKDKEDEEDEDESYT